MKIVQEGKASEELLEAVINTDYCDCQDCTDDRDGASY